MSRAINLDVPLNDVSAACAGRGLAISAIETLPSGCTRVVLCSSDDAEILRRFYKTKIITKPVARTPLSVATRNVPLTTASTDFHPGAVKRAAKG